MKIQLFLLVSLFCLAGQLKGQDQTTGKTRTLPAGTSRQVLVVAYEPKMYISDVTRELCLANEMDTEELRRILREGLAQIVSTEIGQHADVTDLLNEGETQYLKDLQNIYSSITYDFIKVPVPDTVKVKEKSPDQVGRGTTVENGELRTYYDGKERFMDARVVDKRILSYLEKQYQADYIVFLNELDIRVLRNGPSALNNELPRQIKVHYTILDIKGKKVFGSAIMMNYAFGERDVFKLVRSYFPAIGEGIARILFPAESTSPTPNFSRQ